MKKIILDEVTLLGIDCLDLDRLMFAAGICQKHIRFAQVKLLSDIGGNNPGIVRIAPVKSKEEYSRFILKELYRFIETKYVLVFQWDGFILNPFAWNDLFLQYDYIGAPWFINDDYNVGNGGFSLRSRKLMEMVALDDHIDKCHPEDNVICRTYGEYLRKKGFSFAPAKIAELFSVEGAKWEGQFGFHRAEISNWNIHDYTDAITDSKYIGLFKHYFGGDAVNYHALKPDTSFIS